MIVALLSGCSGTSAAPSGPGAPAAPMEATVTIENFQFTPASVTIARGGTVTWINRDPVAHSATPDTEGAFAPTGLLEPGASKTVTFGQAGAVPYHCGPHPAMRGSVRVQ